MPRRVKAHHRSVIILIAGLVIAGWLGAPTLAFAQAPWEVALTPTMNPLPVGFCAAIHLTALDPSSREVARNPLGQRVTIADFDVTVTSPDGTSAAAQHVDAHHVSACGCQRATPGTTATITATYPAQNLPARARVPGIAFRKVATFTLAAPKGDANPQACTQLALAPVPQMPSEPVALEPSPPRTTTPAPPIPLTTQKGSAQTLNLPRTPTVRNIPTQTMDLSATTTRVIRNITTPAMDLSGTFTRVVRTITTATMSLTVQ